MNHNYSSISKGDVVEMLEPATDTKTLYIVSPCYNEEAALVISVPVFIKKLNSLISESHVSAGSRLLLVNDGSTDRTLDVIRDFASFYPNRIEILSLVHNSGETAAYLEGMRKAAQVADVIVTIDCDLQDDIDVISDMLCCYENGAEIVYGCRPSRKSDPFFYRICADCFYYLMRLFGSKIIPHTSQYRLMTKTAVNHILKYADRKNLFLPAQIPLLGLKSSKVYYVRKERAAGKSKYSYSKLMRLASSAFKEYTVMYEVAAVSMMLTVVTAAYIIWKRQK